LFHEGLKEVEVKIMGKEEKRGLLPFHEPKPINHIQLKLDSIKEKNESKIMGDEEREGTDF
jgi:hypothetical protein